MMLSISRKRLIAFIVTEVIKSKREFDARLIDIELAFLFDSMSRINRTPRLLRPKTMAYWTDIFPYLNDESELIVFKPRFAFCDLRSIGCLISYSNILTIYPHPFDLKLLLKFKFSTISKSSGISPTGTIFGVSQGSVAHFTKRLLKPFWTPSNIIIIICINQTRLRCGCLYNKGSEFFFSC